MGHDNARLVGPRAIKGSLQVQAIIGGDIDVSYGGHFQACWGLSRMFIASSLVLQRLDEECKAMSL